MRKPVIDVKALNTLREINFGDCYFERVKVSDKDFTDQKIEDLSFEQVLLESVTLNQAEIDDLKVLDSVFLKCNLAGTVIEQSHLTRMEISGTRMQGAQLTQARMIDVFIKGSNLTSLSPAYQKSNVANAASMWLSFQRLQSSTISRYTLFKTKILHSE